MLRRSLRLQSNGYYDSEGEPAITYKETLYRIFQRRKTVFLPGGGEGTSAINNYDANRETDVDFDRDINRDTDGDDNSCRRISDSFSYSYTNDNYSKTYSNSYVYNYTNKKTTSVRDRNSERIGKSRGPSMSKLKMLFLILLPLCFAFAFSIPALCAMFLDSGPSESPTSTATTNTNSNSGCDAMYRTNLRKIQDELLRLKKHLLSTADTLPNFALETQGASIVLHLTSDTYRHKSGWTLFGIPLWYPAAYPQTVIQGHSPFTPGRCWPFVGGQGQLFVALSHRVTISHVALGHISENVSPTGSITSAPKMFSVYGMENLQDEGTKLGTFLYDQDGDPDQTFKVPDHKKGAFAFVKLEINSNWGHPDFTCLYGFKVHGKLAD